MWTDITRAKHARNGLRYSSDLTGAEWVALEALLPPSLGAWPLAEMVAARDHGGLVLRTAQRSALADDARDLPPASTLQRYFYRRRIGLAHDGAAMPNEIVRLNRQIMTMRRGIGRLIDSYAEGLIDKAEFEPRIAGLKHRLSQLEERHRAALDAIEIERDLSLVISRLEDFSLPNASMVSTGPAYRKSYAFSCAGSKSMATPSRSFPDSDSGRTKPASSIWQDRGLATMYRRWSRDSSPGSIETAASQRTSRRPSKAQPRVVVDPGMRPQSQGSRPRKSRHPAQARPQHAQQRKARHLRKA